MVCALIRVEQKINFIICEIGLDFNFMYIELLDKFGTAVV